MRRFFLRTVFAAIFAAAGLGQGANPEFEVASIKRLAQPSNFMRGRGGPGTADPGLLTIENVTLKGLLMGAYHLLPMQISGPDWLDTEHYNVIATIPPETTRQEMSVMMQNLLTKRFQLALRHARKEFSVYELTVGKRGTKLKASSPESQHNPGQETRTVNGRVQVTFRAWTMEGVATWLGVQLSAPVFNSTGLAEMYDVTFEFAPEVRGASPPDTGDPFTVPIQNVLEEQLGLRLQRGKRAMEVLLIDRAQKNPTEE